MVFLHGLLVDGELWRKVTPLLQGDGALHRPDLPLGSHRIAMNADADLTPAGVARLVGRPPRARSTSTTSRSSATTPAARSASSSRSTTASGSAGSC